MEQAKQNRYYYIIKTGGKIVKKSTEATHLKLEELQEIIGGWVERTWMNIGHKYTLVADEDGYCKDLFPNYVASRLYKFSTLVGDVVVTKTDGFMCFTDEQAKVFEEELKKAVHIVPTEE